MTSDEDLINLRHIANANKKYRYIFEIFNQSKSQEKHDLYQFFYKNSQRFKKKHLTYVDLKEFAQHLLSANLASISAGQLRNIRWKYRSKEMAKAALAGASDLYKLVPLPNKPISKTARFSIPLRQNFEVIVDLPTDMTREDLKRLIAMIELLPLDLK